MKTFAKSLAIAVGVVAILAAALGLLYNVSSATGISRVNPADPELKGVVPLYFYMAYWTMLTISTTCYVLLLPLGIELVRLRFRWTKWLTRLLIFEVVYVFSVPFLSIIPRIGMSIAAAMGVANGGLSAQLVILFPLWAPFAVAFAKRRLNIDSEMGLPALGGQAL